MDNSQTNLLETYLLADLLTPDDDPKFWNFIIKKFWTVKPDKDTTYVWTVRDNLTDNAYGNIITVRYLRLNNEGNLCILENVSHGNILFPLETIDVGRPTINEQGQIMASNSLAAAQGSGFGGAWSWIKNGDEWIEEKRISSSRA